MIALFVKPSCTQRQVLLREGSTSSARSVKTYACRSGMLPKEIDVQEERAGSGGKQAPTGGPFVQMQRTKTHE